MDIMSIIQSALSVIITGLITFATSKLIQLINSKIEDKKAANYLSTIINLVGDSVKTVYQTYVESLKNSGSFNEAAQKEAYNRCLSKVKSQLVPEVVDYVMKNFGDLDSYLKSLIESAIYSLKR